MNIILKPFAWLLLFFNNITGGYGLALVLFALVVKAILFPFALKGKRSMIKVNMLSGQMQRLQKQYANNKQKYNEEVQKLYAKEKVNPMGGCLWSFLPLLILLPLYAIIRQPMQYMMNLTAEQIAAAANALDWSNVAFQNGWIREAAAYVTGGYNELFLASLIRPENLSAVQAVAPGAFAMNFQFLGMNLAQVPQWQIWTQPLTWNNIGLFLMPLLSAGLSIVMSVVSMRTNSMNGQGQQTNSTSRMMMIFSLAMSLWIGYIMPAGLCLYWIANNVLSIAQEIICGKMLKKDYEAAAEAKRKQELLAKEEEKRKKKALAEERARRAEEKKQQKGKKKEKSAGAPGVDVSASRVGIRAYARGRAYDPNRYGGVTAYRDPEAAVDESAIEAALEKKAEAKEEAELEAEIQAKVTAEVEQEYTEGKLTGETADAEDDAEDVDDVDTDEETAEDTGEDVDEDAADEETDEAEDGKEEEK